MTSVALLGGVVVIGAARPLGESVGRDDGVAQGLHYDIHKTVVNTPAPDSTEPNPQPSTTTALAHVQVANGKSRVDVADGYFLGIWLSPGDYLIVSDSGRTMVLVNPSNKLYAPVDLAQMQQGGNSFANAFGGMMGVQASNVKVEATALGSDKLPQGMATKYRITEDYTVTIAVMGMDATTTNHSTTDLWYLPASTSIVSPFGVPIKKEDPTTGFYGPDYAKQMTAAKAKLPAGMPIKIVASTVTTDVKGNHASNTTTWEFTNIAQAPVADNAFDVPAGFTQFTGPLALMPTPSGGAATAGATTAGQPAGKSTGSAVGNAAAGAANGVVDAAKQGASNGVTNTVNQAASDAAASTVKKILHLP
jgi:hypothetical protein